MLTIDELERIHSEHCLDGELNLFLLADHSGLPELARKLRENGIGWTNLFGDDKRPELTAASPLLFEIAFSDHRPVKGHFLRWLNDRGRFSSSLLLIASNLTLQDLAKGLKKRCDGVLSEGEAIVIRYFDTRVLPHLLEVMPDVERSIWLGIASQWWFIDRCGEVVQIRSESIEQDDFENPMQLSDDQMSRLLHASEIDQVAYILENNIPEQFGNLHSVERYGFISKKSAAAREIGLSSLGDLALYCGLALLNGLDFDVQPLWRDALMRVKKKEISLSTAVDLVDSLKIKELH